MHEIICVGYGTLGKVREGGKVPTYLPYSSMYSVQHVLGLAGKSTRPARLSLLQWLLLYHMITRLLYASETSSSASTVTHTLNTLFILTNPLYNDTLPLLYSFDGRLLAFYHRILTMAEALSTPRISAEYLGNFTNQTVRMIGKVMQLRGDQATIDSNGNVTAVLNRVCGPLNTPIQAIFTLLRHNVYSGLLARGRLQPYSTVG